MFLQRYIFSSYPPLPSPVSSFQIYLLETLMPVDNIFFFFPKQEGGLEEASEGIPFPRDCGKSLTKFFTSRKWIFAMKKILAYFTMATFYFFLESHKKKIFIRSSPWEPDGIKATIVLWPPGVSLFYTSPLINTASSNSSKLTFKYYTSLWIQQLLLQANRSRLCISGCTCLSRFQSGGFSCNLSFLMGPWKAVNFQFI